MNKKLLFYIFITCQLFLSNEIFAQKQNEIALSLGTAQIKDDFNNGIVFTGAQISFDYQYSYVFSTIELAYNPKIALGIPFSRGMIAVNLNFVPIDISAYKPILNSNKHIVKAGANFATNYSYQSYPDLHAARLFWFGEIGISPIIQYVYQWNRKKIEINLQNSILGFVSRKKENLPYFYSLKFSDFFVAPHQNMKFGSFDKYNHTKIAIRYAPNISKRNTLGFEMEYVGTYFDTRFQNLNYALQWKRTL